MIMIEIVNMIINKSINQSTFTAPTTMIGDFIKHHHHHHRRHNQ